MFDRQRVFVRRLGLTVRDELDEQENATSNEEERRQQRSPRTFLQQDSGNNVGRDLSGRRQKTVHEGIPAQVGRVQGQTEIPDVYRHPAKRKTFHLPCRVNVIR